MQSPLCREVRHLITKVKNRLTSKPAKNSSLMAEEHVETLVLEQDPPGSTADDVSTSYTVVSDSKLTHSTSI